MSESTHCRGGLLAAILASDSILPSVPSNWAILRMNASRRRSPLICLIFSARALTSVNIDGEAFATPSSVRITSRKRRSIAGYASDSSESPSLTIAEISLVTFMEGGIKVHQLRDVVEDKPVRVARLLEEPSYLLSVLREALGAIHPGGQISVD